MPRLSALLLAGLLMLSVLRPARAEIVPYLEPPDMGRTYSQATAVNLAPSTPIRLPEVSSVVLLALVGIVFAAGKYALSRREPHADD